MFYSFLIKLITILNIILIIYIAGLVATSVHFGDQWMDTYKIAAAIAKSKVQYKQLHRHRHVLRCYLAASASISLFRSCSICIILKSL